MAGGHQICSHSAAKCLFTKVAGRTATPLASYDSDVLGACFVTWQGASGRTATPLASYDSDVLGACFVTWQGVVVLECEHSHTLQANPMCWGALSRFH